MLDLARTAVDAALAAGADYADARVNRLRQEQLSVRNGAVGEAEASEEFGLGVRVRRDGCFGFAAAPLGPGDSSALARELARRAARSALDLAPALRAPRELAGREEHVAEYETPVEIDPFAVPLKERLDLLREAEASLRGAAETVVREARCSLRREEQWQASSEGARIHQVLVRSGAGISSTAADCPATPIARRT